MSRVRQVRESTSELEAVRHLVKPGLTGWWQLCGRGELLMHQHTELDLYYVRNMYL